MALALRLKLVMSTANAMSCLSVFVPVDGERMTMPGREPLIPTADGVAEPENRRVEIRVR